MNLEWKSSKFKDYQWNIPHRNTNEAARLFTDCTWGRETIMNRFKNYSLDFKKTYQYFIKHISYDNELSNLISDSIKFETGEFFTILHDKVDLDKLYNYGYGGIVPVKDNIILTMEKELSKMIKDYLDKDIENCVIVDDVIVKPNETDTQFSNVDISFFQNEVYHIFNNKNTINEIFSTIRGVNQLWHFLAVFSKTPLSKIYLNHKTINTLIQNIKLIVTTAYDGEGYIFWKKNK